MEVEKWVRAECVREKGNKIDLKKKKRRKRSNKVSRIAITTQKEKQTDNNQTYIII